MKISQLISKPTYESERIADEAQGLGWDYAQLLFENLTLTNEFEQAIAKDFNSANAILTRVNTEGKKTKTDISLRNTLLNHSEIMAKKFLNYKSYLESPLFSKTKQSITFKNNNIPIPKTFFHTMREKIKFPIVLKGNYGNKGSSVHLIESEKSLQEISQLYGEGNYLIQEFIPTGADYRVFVIGEKVAGMMKKISTTGFLTNFNAGGETALVEKEKVALLSKLGIATAKALHCEAGGVDVMFKENGDPVVFELNRSAGFKGLESTTNINIAQLLLKHLQKTRG